MKEEAMNEQDFNWPKKGDKVFKPSPPSVAGVPLEAFVMPSEGTYLVGFQRAADLIVEAARSESGNPDDLFFPVAYLYRHHLELMLKELVRLGVQMGSLDECERILGGHNLQELWKTVQQLIMEAWPGRPPEDLIAAEHSILEFHKLDPSGQAFRYARDKKGAPHLQAAPPVVDLTNLKGVVDGVSRFLDASYAGIEHCDPGLL